MVKYILYMLIRLASLGERCVRWMSERRLEYLPTGNDVTLLELTEQAESPLQAVFRVKVCWKKAENQVQK